MDDVVKWVTVAITIIQQRRAAGFPVAKEIVALVAYIMNPKPYTAEEWAEHNKAQEDSRDLRRRAVPRDA